MGELAPLPRARTPRLDALPQWALSRIARCLDLGSVLRLTETSRRLCDVLSADRALWLSLSDRYFGAPHEQQQQQPTTRALFAAEWARRRRQQEEEEESGELCSRGLLDNDELLGTMSLPRRSPLRAERFRHVPRALGSRTDANRAPSPLTAFLCEHGMSAERPPDEPCSVPADKAGWPRLTASQRVSTAAAGAGAAAATEATDKAAAAAATATAAPAAAAKEARQSLFGGDDDDMDEWFAKKLEEARTKKQHHAKRRADAAVSMYIAPSTHHSAHEPPAHAHAHTQPTDTRQRALSSTATAARARRPAYRPEEYRFGALIERPENQPLKRGIENFVKRFERETRGQVAAEAALVHALLRDVEREMRRRPVWRSLPPNHFAAAKADMERWVYSRLYPVIFVKREYQQRDAATAAHIATVRSVLKPVYLDLAPDVADSAALPEAVHELQRLDRLKTPLEKITCVHRAAKIASAVLAGRQGAAASADDFLPLFIYVVAQADLRTPHSTIEFVEHYLDPEERYGEAYCFFTHLVSAVAFLGDLKPDEVAAAVRAKTEQQRRAAADKAEGPASASLFPDAFVPLNLSPAHDDDPPQQQHKEAANFVEAEADPLAHPAAAPPTPPTSAEDAAASSSSPTAAAAAAAAASAALSAPAAGLVASAEAEAHVEMLRSSEERRFPPARLEGGGPACDADSEFLAQLHFLHTRDAPRSPEEVALLLAEYKQLAEVAQRHMPTVTRLRSWHKSESVKRSVVVDLPATERAEEAADVTCLLVHEGTVWAGTSSGCVWACDAERAEATTCVQAHRAPVAKLLAVDRMLWCVSAAGAVAQVDLELATLAGKPFGVLDRRHSSAVAAAYDAPAGLVWCVGVPEQSHSGGGASGGVGSSLRRARQETLLVRVATSTGAVKSSVVAGTATAAAVFRGELWVAFDDGRLVSYSAVTGQSTGALGPLCPGRVQLAATRRAQQLWLTAGDTLQALSSTTGIDIKPVQLGGLTAHIAHIAAGCVPWNRPITTTTTTTAAAAVDFETSKAAETEAQEREQEEEREDCDVVVSVDTAGTLCVWNTLDRTCEVVLETPLRPPACLACSERSDKGRVWWVAAQQNTLHCWSYS